MIPFVLIITTNIYTVQTTIIMTKPLLQLLVVLSNVKILSCKSFQHEVFHNWVFEGKQSVLIMKVGGNIAGHSYH